MKCIYDVELARVKCIYDVELARVKCIYNVATIYYSFIERYYISFVEKWMSPHYLD